MKSKSLLSIILLCLCSCKGSGLPIEEDIFEIYQSGVTHLKRTQVLAGTSAMHCGAVKDIPTDIYNCMSVSHKARRPFYVYYSVQGMDSFIWVSVAYDGKSLFILNHDTYGLEEKYSGYECRNPMLMPYDKNLFKHGVPFQCA